MVSQFLNRPNRTVVKDTTWPFKVMSDPIPFSQPLRVNAKINCTQNLCRCFTVLLLLCHYSLFPKRELPLPHIQIGKGAIKSIKDSRSALAE